MRLSCMLGLVFCLTAFGADAPPSTPKILIEFGWDEPDTAFLRANIATMEQTPFDGCVFHAVARSSDGKLDDLAWKAWSNRTFRKAELAQAFEDLKATKFHSFTHNFLRINTTPADLDWFDDHAAILANLRLAAELAREGKCHGILLDTEQYQGKLFSYEEQRDEKKISFQKYASQARRRGKEVMTALQRGYPDLTIMFTFGPSYVSGKTNGSMKSMADAEYGLLLPFVEGMAEAKTGKTRLIDGHEPSYGYREFQQFEAARKAILTASPTLEAGFGLWLDYNHPKHGWNVDLPDSNYFTPQGFENSLRAALDHSDGIVWIYTETPRWWTREGGATKLPQPYIDAIRRARKR